MLLFENGRSMLRTVVATALALIPTAAFADNFSVFQVQGTFQGVGASSLSGTLTLDTTTGKFTADTLGVYSASGSLLDTFFPPSSQGFLADGRYSLQFYDFNSFYQPPNNSYSSLYLKLPMLPSAGQTLQLCTINTPCVMPLYSTIFESYGESVSGGSGQYRSDTGLITGQISPLGGPAATPEPSSFALLGTGLLAIGVAFRRRLCRC